ncbi:MAG: hypothetical protein ACD_62C00176G0001 [uncultured bacterium]|nr:MAG: hypothetical protein ACD_62C00176G0001 [uncultured bacterium]
MENIVDQIFELNCLVMNDLQKSVCGWWITQCALHQGFGITQDRCEWCFHFVRNIGRKITTNLFSIFDLGHIA